MIATRAQTTVGMALAVAILLIPATLQAQNSQSTEASAHRAILEQYCVGCHSGLTPFAGLNLQPLDASDLEANGIIWEKMLRKLRNREMPPAGMPRPDAATYEALVKYIETGRDRLAEAKPNPGRTTLHRLNRTEYGNAIRDLFVNKYAPEIDLANWRFEIDGLVERNPTFSLDEFMQLPAVKVYADFHCVTRWSRLDNVWTGVSTAG